MGGLSIWHILLVVAVIVLIFGAAKLPSLAKNLGKSMKIFRDEVKDLSSDKADDKPEITEQNRGETPTANDTRDTTQTPK